MKSKSTSNTSIRMPDSEIRVGLEAAKKPRSKGPAKAPFIKRTGMPEEEPMVQPMKKKKRTPKRK